MLFRLVTLRFVFSTPLPLFLAHLPSDALLIQLPHTFRKRLYLHMEVCTTVLLPTPLSG